MHGYLVPFVPWNEQHTSDVLRTKIIYIEEFFDTYLALDLFFRVGLPSDIPLSDPPGSRLDTDADNTESS